MINEHFFTDQASWLAATEVYCIDSLQSLIGEKATVYLSGGSTPLPLYQQLARHDLPFDAFDWALVDERWVEPDHPRSNFSAINAAFEKAAGFHLTPMKNSATTPAEGLQMLETAYNQLAERVGLTILGMGGDGHTASFFPNAEGLDDALDLGCAQKVAAIHAIPSDVTGLETDRATLTLNQILRSENIALLISGESKKEKFYEALETSALFSLPVSALLQQQAKTIDVFWYP
ncbi:MAG: 6-phosphogluconolactonase [Cellvibrionales bacterium]|nr:6-phosphogluconolactonase [Cellvibrionales bacterium]